METSITVLCYTALTKYTFRSPQQYIYDILRIFAGTIYQCLINFEIWEISGTTSTTKFLEYRLKSKEVQSPVAILTCI